MTRRADGTLTVQREVSADVDVDDGELFAAFDDAWDHGDRRELFALVCRLFAITCSVASRELPDVPRMRLVACDGAVQH